ncbi:thioesterase II family protein [Streptomyces sp. NPDC059819]|uniref:thioesterase II family protein n=1 Tax=Streptomyces sp. NPDC059819 TaxID=3346963 RepID=UPI0036578C98
MNPPPTPPRDIWLRQLDDQNRAATRLICFPHAGGSATAFRPWLDHWNAAPELWSVQYPGREERAEEPPPKELPRMAGEIAVALQWMTDKSYAFFGHSMGALAAYETTCQLLRLGLPLPTLLIASGSAPPKTSRPPAAAAGQDDIAWLGTSEAAADDELQAITQRTLSSDLEMLAHYDPGPSPSRLPVPLTALRYRDDPELDVETCRRWNALTQGPFTETTLPGDHFACYRQPEGTVKLLRRVWNRW